MKKIAVKIVRSSSAVTHVIVTYIANLTYATCNIIYRIADWLAMAEGKIVEAIDKREYHKYISMERQENTDAAFEFVSDKIKKVVSFVEGKKDNTVKYRIEVNYL